MIPIFKFLITCFTKIPTLPIIPINLIIWALKKIFSLAKAPPYNPETANIEDTKKINELIVKCVDNYGAKAKEFESYAKIILDEYYLRIVKELDSFSSVETLPDFLYNALKRETELLKEKIDNSYHKEISQIFSLNNNTLIDILRKNPGSQKENALKSLAIDALEKANNNFITYFKNVLKTQQTLFETEINKIKTGKIVESEHCYNEFESLKDNITNNINLEDTILKLNLSLAKLEKINEEE